MFPSAGVGQTLWIVREGILIQTLVILRVNREILLINSALKRKKVVCDVRSHFTLQSLSLNNSASLNYSQHRVPASVRISNHQPCKKEIWAAGGSFALWQKSMSLGN